MRKSFIILLVVVLLIAGLYFFWSDISKLFICGAVDSDSVNDRDDEEDIIVGDYDDFPHKAFPRFYDLGEPDMVLEDGSGVNSDGSPEIWYVYGVDPDQESRMKGVRSLDYKEAEYFLCIPTGEGNEYYAPDEFCSDRTHRHLYRNLHMGPKSQESRYSSYEVTYYGDELWETDPEASLALSNDEAFQVVDFKFIGVSSLRVGSHLWVNDELTDDDGCEFNNLDSAQIRAIAYWDGVSESIIMYTNDPASPGSDLIIHLYDIVYDPELPDYLFEPPVH